MTTIEEKYNWAKLNRLQLGKYAEYLVKMEFVLHGCDVFSSEVDDHGIDFVIRTRNGDHYDVQVKSFRLEPGKGTPYVFLQKAKFVISPSLLLALVQFVVGQPPVLWLVPSCLNGKANPLFEGRDYGEGKKSAPEWGLTLSKKKLAQIAEQCSFEAVVKAIESRLSEASASGA